MFGAFGGALRTSVTFVSQAASRNPEGAALGLRRPLERCGALAVSARRDMILNDWQPKLEVDAETYEVRADGELLTVRAAQTLPMSQRYFLF
jgi:urease subunit alpha